MTQRPGAQAHPVVGITARAEAELVLDPGLGHMSIYQLLEFKGLPDNGSQPVSSGPL